jgi:single-stranded-DNA-specific exonuclease
VVCTIVAHGDSDGVASASLFKAFLEGSGREVRVVFSHPVGLYQDLREYAEGSDCVVIADIALDELRVADVVPLLGELAGRASVTYVDHHPLPEGFKPPERVRWVHDTCCSTSELAFRYLSNLGLDPEYSRVALYGAIGDYLDETPWVRQELLRWDRRSVYLEAGILVQGLEGSRRDHDFKRRVVEHLSRNSLPSAMAELVERALRQASEDENLRIWVRGNVRRLGRVSYVVNPPGSVGRAATYARVYGGGRVGVAIEERRDTYVMSLRAEPGVDLNRILRELSRVLGISGGGHPQAAGARVRKELLETFLGELDRRLDQGL